MKITLRQVKLLHTIIWLFFMGIFSYILYAGIADKLDWSLWIAIGAVIMEVIVLLIFGWRCPLTILGEDLTDKTEIGFDIYLPKWLAKHNKTIFGSLFVMELALIGFRLIT